MAGQNTWNWVAHHVKFPNFFFQHLLNPVEDRFLRWHDAVEIVHVHDGSDLGVECAREKLVEFLQFCQIVRKSIFDAKLLKQIFNPTPRGLSHKLTGFRRELLGSTRSFWMSNRHLFRHLFSVVGIGIVFERGIRYARHVGLGVFRNTQTLYSQENKRALRRNDELTRGTQNWKRNAVLCCN